LDGLNEFAEMYIIWSGEDIEEETGSQAIEIVKELPSFIATRNLLLRISWLPTK